MKKFPIVVLIVLCITQNVFSATKIIDKTLAVVNGQPIFESDFNEVFAPLMKIYKRVTPIKEQTDQGIKELRNLVLDEKINEIVLLHEAKKQKIEVSKKEIEDTISSLKKMFKNESTYNSWVAETNMTTENLKNRIMLKKLLEKKVSQNIKIPTEAELKLFYDKTVAMVKNNNDVNLNFSNLSNILSEDSLIAVIASEINKKSSEFIKVRYIFVDCPENAAASVIKTAVKTINIIKKQLKNHTFADLAKQYSVNSSNNKTNDDGLIIIMKNDKGIHSNISKTAFCMNVGDYTKEPIKTNNGYYFIKIEEKHASKNISFNDVKNDIYKILQQYNLAKSFYEYVNILKSKANIKIVT